MNDIMSGGIHRIWKDRFVQMLDPYPGSTVVDVAGGTGTNMCSIVLIEGDIAFRIANNMHSRPFLYGKNESRVIVCDINSSMLSKGRERSIGKDYYNGMPTWESTDSRQSFRGWWVTPRICRFPTPPSTHTPLRSAFATLRTLTGGAGGCTCSHQGAARGTPRAGARRAVPVPGVQPRAQPGSPQVRGSMVVGADDSIYDTYSMQAIPIFGELIANDMASYQYLVESIRRFPNQEQFCAMIKV
jgi:hypothetical protein